MTRQKVVAQCYLLACMDTMEPVEDIDYVCHDEHQLSRLLHFSAVVDLGKGGS